MDDIPTVFQLFRSSAEAQSARNRLDPAEPMPKDKYSGLAGKIDFEASDYVKCQLVDEDSGGGMCRKEHGHGYIMIRDDGVEGYIGHVCVKRHFKTNYAEIRGAMNKVDRDIKLTELVERLQSLLNDADLLVRHDDGVAQLEILRKQVDRSRRQLDQYVLYSLDKMVATGRVVRLEFEYLEKREDHQKRVYTVPVWRRESVGSVIAPDALDTGALQKLDTRLSAAADAFSEGRAARDVPYKILQKWALALEDIDLCRSLTIEAEERLSRFLEPTNLKLLVWLSRTTEDCVDTMRAVLDMSGVKGNDPAKVLNAWRAEVEAQHGNHRSRLAD